MHPMTYATDSHTGRTYPAGENHPAALLAMEYSELAEDHFVEDSPSERRAFWLLADSPVAYHEFHEWVVRILADLGSGR